MILPRIIPVLLLKDNGLVKTLKFDEPKYIGDPINAVKIFNEKEVDELMLLDIAATNEKREPGIEMISEIVSEAFMPVAYGGGLRSVDDIRAVLKAGVEKITLNTAAVEQPGLIAEAARIFGSQSIVVSIDVKRNTQTGKMEIYTHGGTVNTGLEPVEFAAKMEAAGAGELVLNAIDKDGTMAGYDLPLIREIVDAVTIPVIACGGAGGLDDFHAVISQTGASAAAAGSLFVFCGSRDAILITYPERKELETIFTWRRRGENE